MPQHSQRTSIQSDEYIVGLRATAKHPEWKRHYRKKIDRLAIRIRNLVDDLHRREAYDLVQNFDVILLPPFETKEMSAKTDRKLRTAKSWRT